MVHLLLASHNQGKVAEVQQLLSSNELSVLEATDVGIPDDFEVAETGETFAQNAELKAKGFAEALLNTKKAKIPNLWVLADDSGLTVDALHGQPGVYSKRFVSGTDADRNQALLAKLAHLRTFDQRTAHYIAVFCIYQPYSHDLHFFEGRVDGEIAFAQRGNEGFGYDPLFMPEGYEQTFGELGVEVKNTMSHRAKAAQQLRSFLQEKVL